LWKYEHDIRLLIASRQDLLINFYHIPYFIPAILEWLSRIGGLEWHKLIALKGHTSFTLRILLNGYAVPALGEEMSYLRLIVRLRWDLD
jgi:hypothetical protein